VSRLATAARTTPTLGPAAREVPRLDRKD
jgi:hypothetical protein